MGTASAETAWNMARRGEHKKLHSHFYFIFDCTFGKVVGDKHFLFHLYPSISPSNRLLLSRLVIKPPHLQKSFSTIGKPTCKPLKGKASLWLQPSPTKFKRDRHFRRNCLSLGTSAMRATEKSWNATTPKSTVSCPTTATANLYLGFSSPNG